MRPRVMAAILAVLLAGAVAVVVAPRTQTSSPTPTPREEPRKPAVSPLPTPVTVEEPRAGEKTEFLLTMDGGDEVTERYVSRVLYAQGIWSTTEGSLGWSTSVRSRERAEAEKWLRKEEGLRGYVAWLPGYVRESLRPPKLTTVQIGADYASALQSQPPESVVGRILRSEDFARALGGSTTAKIESVSWVERPLVTEDLKPTTAIVGTVALLDLRPEVGHPTTCTVILEGE